MAAHNPSAKACVLVKRFAVVICSSDAVHIMCISLLVHCLAHVHERSVALNLFLQDWSIWKASTWAGVSVSKMKT